MQYVVMCPNICLAPLKCFAEVLCTLHSFRMTKALLETKGKGSVSSVSIYSAMFNLRREFIPLRDRKLRLAEESVMQTWIYAAVFLSLLFHCCQKF